MSAPCSPSHPKYIDNGYVQLVSVIGNGAYGVVFYALDYRYGRPIKRAVKQLRRHGIDERQRRFQMREINLHRRASSHPSIIHMDRLIQEPDCVYVVMDYGDEGDLFAMITEKQRVSGMLHVSHIVACDRRGQNRSSGVVTNLQYAGDNDLIRSVFMQVLDGVDWLHQLGIAHRDVKPENIVCSQDGTRVRIVDFGLATSEPTSSEFGCGSTFYIAPECLGEWSSTATSYATRSADVWSLGVILVNLVCGRNPWRCASPTDESFAAFLQDPTFLRRILPISGECLSILTEIFTLDPEQRISLDRLRELIMSIGSFTDDAHVPTSRSRAAAVASVPVHVPIPVHHTQAPAYADVTVAGFYDDAEPVFSFDDPELDLLENEPPALRADSGSPPPHRSSSGSSDGPFPPTPRLDISHAHTTPRVASVSSFTSPVFEAFGNVNRKGAALSPIPFATPAMFL